MASLSHATTEFLINFFIFGRMRVNHQIARFCGVLMKIRLIKNLFDMLRVCFCYLFQCQWKLTLCLFNNQSSQIQWNRFVVLVQNAKPLIQNVSHATFIVPPYKLSVAFGLWWVDRTVAHAHRHFRLSNIANRRFLLIFIDRIKLQTKKKWRWWFWLFSNWLRNYIWRGRTLSIPMGAHGWDRDLMLYKIRGKDNDKNIHYHDYYEISHMF